MRKTVTFELSEEQAEFLHATADREARPVGDVVADFVQQQMDHDAWVVARVQEGIEALEHGDTLTHEEVAARAEARRTELMQRSVPG